MDYERATIAGDYAAPVAEIEAKADEGGVDELLWRLHAGGSRYLMNDFPASVEQFDRAEDIFIRNDQAGVFKQGSSDALAMVSNDRAFPYSGGGEDRVFACFYKAVDYMCAGDAAAARTELNRAAQHQDNWLWARRKEIADAAEELKKSSDAYARKEGGGASGVGADDAKSAKAVQSAFANADFRAQVLSTCGFDMAVDGDVETLARRDWLNRYVQHVTGAFRWTSGDGDAEAFLRELSEIDPGNVHVAADFASVKGGGRPQNQVWIYVEDGMCPVREEWRLDLPTVVIPFLGRYVMYAGMALPYLRYRDSACASYEATAGGRVVPLGELQDVDKLLKTEFDVYFRGALVREITRTVVKVGVQVALGVTADNARDNATKIALSASQIGAAAWAASVTQADLRNWTGLPKKVFSARVVRPADGRIVVTGAGMPVAEVRLPEGNSFVFVRKPSAQSPAVVKIATLPN